MSDLLNHMTEAVLSDYDRLRETYGALDLDAWTGIELTGDDRKGWLQGQVTNDLRQLTPGTYSAACLCAPTGHLLAVLDVWALTDRFFVTTQRETAPAFLDRVRQMVILEDVAAEEVGERYRGISVQGPEATRALSEMLPLPTLDAGEAEFEGTPIRCLRSNRTGMGGWDLWVPAAAREAYEQLSVAFPRVSHESFNVARLEAGMPFWGADMGAKTLPPEMGAYFGARHISYTKGCYTGQEVLMRIHSRGHTNRTWMGLVAESPLEIGGVVATPSNADAGIVTSAAYSPDYGPIGAAMLRNEIATEGEIVRVQTERGEVEAEVRRMPLLRFD